MKRRCLCLYLDYPSAERERDIIRTRVPELPERLVEQLGDLVTSLRRLELRKSPSVSERIDFAQTLVLLGSTELDAAAVRLNVLLYRNALSIRADRIRHEVRRVVRELLVAYRGAAAGAHAARAAAHRCGVDDGRARAGDQDRAGDALVKAQTGDGTLRRGPLYVRATIRASMATCGARCGSRTCGRDRTNRGCVCWPACHGRWRRSPRSPSTLVTTMSQAYSRMRIFAFVEEIRDVTELIREADDPVRALNSTQGMMFCEI